LQAWPADASQQYLDNLDRIIGLGELRLVRDLNLDIFDHVITLALTQGERIVQKPSNWIATRSLRIGPETFYLLTEDDEILGLEDGSGGFLLEEAEDVQETRSYPLEMRSWDFCHEFAPDPLIQGRPRYFNELNDTQWEVVPTSDSNYGVICRYVRRPTDSLSQDNPDATNWLARSVPDALFAACLAEAEHFLKADDRYADYINKYHNEILPIARAELRNLIRAGDYNPVKPAAETVK